MANRDNSKNRRNGNHRNNRYSNKGRGGNASKETTSNSSSGASTTKLSNNNSAIANIISNSANIAVRNVAGNKVSPEKINGAVGLSVGASAKGDFYVPGVFGVAYVPLVGAATGAQNEAVNVAARNVWMNLRSLYSNKIPYTAAAIMQYMLAMDSIMMVFQAIKRAYGIIFAYDPKNRYVPDALLAAQGINPVNFRKNLPSVKITLNEVASILSSFGVPTQFDFMYDHVDAAAHILMDGVSPTAQFIIPYPAFAWKMDWPNNKLVAVDWRDDTQTDIGYYESVHATGGPSSPWIALAPWSTIETTLRGMVEALVNNEDCYQIACDMLRMYGSLAGVAPVDDSYAVGPEYSDFYMNALHNAEWLCLRTLPLSQFEISEVNTILNVGAMKASYTNMIKYGTTPGIGLGAIGSGIYGHVFDFNRPDFTTDDVVTAANWKVNLTPVNSPSTNTDGPCMKIDSCGTLAMSHLTVVTAGVIGGTWTQACDYYELGAVGAANTFVFTDMVWGNTALNPGAAIAGDLIDLWHLHPLVPRVSVKDTINNSIRGVANVGDAHQPSGDMEYYFDVDRSDLKRVHDAICMARFDASGTGTVNLKPKG